MTTIANDNNRRRFSVGTTYTTRLAGDARLTMCDAVVRRTASSVWLEDGKRHKIHTVDGVEIIFPDGRYSKAPVYSADRVAT